MDAEKIAPYVPSPLDSCRGRGIRRIRTIHIEPKEKINLPKAVTTISSPIVGGNGK